MIRVDTRWRAVASGRCEPSRRGGTAGDLIALAAACVLSACSAGPLPDAPAFVGPAPDTPLGSRIDRAPDLRVAGEKLNADLVKRFYARHSFEPVWTTRPDQAHALIEAISRAGDQGLDPEMFHAHLLQHDQALPPLDRDLLLSDAFLTYADALARGALPVEHRSEDEVLTPAPINVPAALDAALDSPDAGAAIEALAPTTPTYLALRQALQKYRAGTSAEHTAAAEHLQAIVVNLERERWLPRSLPPDRAWVNIADQQLDLYHDDRSVFATRVVVGEDIRRNQTPEFHATIDASFFNPPWVVPKDIVDAEILPKIAHDPKYLAKNDMILLPSGEAEQLPGPKAGLGYLMFDMPNTFDVYLHDTPDRDIFKRANRRLSHGCIRVQNPRDLAALLLDESKDSVDAGIAKPGTTRHPLPTPMPVFVVYETAFSGTNGTVQYRPDFYHRDPEIWEKLERHGAPHDAQLQLDNHSTTSCSTHAKLRNALAHHPDQCVRKAKVATPKAKRKSVKHGT